MRLRLHDSFDDFSVICEITAIAICGVANAIKEIIGALLRCVILHQIDGIDGAVINGTVVGTVAVSPATVIPVRPIPVFSLRSQRKNGQDTITLLCVRLVASLHNVHKAAVAVVGQPAVSHGKHDIFGGLGDFDTIRQRKDVGAIHHTLQDIEQENSGNHFHDHTSRL